MTGLSAWEFWGGLFLLVGTFLLVGGLLASAERRHRGNARRIEELMGRKAEPPEPIREGPVCACKVCSAAPDPVCHGYCGQCWSHGCR